jgi:cell wall-associated NlpC family hydrolase
MARLTVAELYALVRRHGAGPGVDRCMVAGALAESEGDPTREGDWEGDHPHSIGLWQLHDQGLGAGLSVAERADPDRACAVILAAYVQWHDYWAAQGLEGEDLAARAYLWAERPADYNVPGSAADRRIRQKWHEANEAADNAALRAAVLAAAASLRGIPYRIDPPPDGVQTLDCSLFVVKTFANAGIPFPLGVRTAEQTRRVCEPIDWPDVRRGDLLFFEHTYDCPEPPGPDGKVATHIGISHGAGTQRMWDCHAANGEDGPPGVGEVDISTPYWQDHLFEARRPRQFAQPAGGGAAPPPAPLAADLASLLGYLQQDVAEALQQALDGARAAPDAHGREEAYGALQAAINTLRRGGPPQESPAPP